VDVAVSHALERVAVLRRSTQQRGENQAVIRPPAACRSARMPRTWVRAAEEILAAVCERGGDRAIAFNVRLRARGLRRWPRTGGAALQLQCPPPQPFSCRCEDPGYTYGDCRAIRSDPLPASPSVDCSVTCCDCGVRCDRSWSMAAGLIGWMPPPVHRLLGLAEKASAFGGRV